MNAPVRHARAMGQMIGGVEIVGPSARAWDDDRPIRVHFYDAKRKGTWHRYFDALEPALEFAHHRKVYGAPCTVEISPRYALEAGIGHKTIGGKLALQVVGREAVEVSTEHEVLLEGLKASLAEQREANRPAALADYYSAIAKLLGVCEELELAGVVATIPVVRFRRPMPKGKTRELVERARQALTVLELNAEFAEDGS